MPSPVSPPAIYPHLAQIPSTISPRPYPLTPPISPHLTYIPSSPIPSPTSPRLAHFPRPSYVLAMSFHPHPFTHMPHLTHMPSPLSPRPIPSLSYYVLTNMPSPCWYVLAPIPSPISPHLAHVQVTLCCGLAAQSQRSHDRQSHQYRSCTDTHLYDKMNGWIYKYV